MGATIIEQLWVVAQIEQEECQKAFFIVAAVAFTLLSLLLVFGSFRRKGGSVLASVLFAAAAVHLSRANDSNKPTPVASATILWDVSLHDFGSVATNDWPEIGWTYDQWIAGDVLHIDARPKGSTNAADWVSYYVGRVTDTFWRGHMPGCTGMTIYVWSEYVEPPPVTTNGVYHLDYLTEPLDYVQESEDLRMWDLLRTPIYDADEKRLMSPPSLPEPLVIEIPQDLVNSFLNNETEIQDEN